MSAPPTLPAGFNFGGSPPPPAPPSTLPADFFNKSPATQPPAAASDHPSILSSMGEALKMAVEPAAGALEEAGQTVAGVVRPVESAAHATTGGEHPIADALSKMAAGGGSPGERLGQYAEGAGEFIAGGEGLKGAAKLLQLGERFPELLATVEKYPKASRILLNTLIGGGQGTVKASGEGAAPAEAAKEGGKEAVEAGGLTALGEGAAALIKKATAIPAISESVDTLDKVLATPGGKGGERAAQMTRALQIAHPDLADIQRTSPIKSKGAEALHELAEKIGAKQQQLWEEGHEPGIARHPDYLTDTNKIADQAESAISDMAQRVNPVEARAAQNWIDEAVRPDMTLSQLDNFVREVNADLRSAKTNDAYGQLQVRARQAAVQGARAEIDRVLQENGEQGVRDVNMRWGSLDSIKDRLEERAVQEGTKEAKKGALPSWVHLYSFLHPGLASMPLSIGAGVRIGEALKGTPSSNLISALKALVKAGAEGAPLPEAPPPAVIRGALPAGVPGVERTPTGGIPMPGESPESRVGPSGTIPGRQGPVPFTRLLGAGEGESGPHAMPPSPLAPGAGSEPTPTGGARGYTSEPQPGSAAVRQPIEVTQAQPAQNEVERTAQRKLPPSTTRFYQGAGKGGRWPNAAK